jgi:phage terminase large subunit-like protein
MSSIKFNDPLLYIRLARYSNRSYEHFIGFVKEFISPNMEMGFQEEPYYRQAWEDIWQYRFDHRMYPRGHSKSELCNVWATIYIAVYQFYNPFYTGTGKKAITQQLVTSSDWDTTGELADRIKYYFEASDELREFLPNRRDKRKYNNKKIELRNGSTIHFRSIKTKRGLHVDRIAGDDLTTESSTLTDAETWKFTMSALLPMGNAKDAMTDFTGTPIRRKDVNMRIQAGEAGKHWHCVKMPAVLDWENKIPLSPNRFPWEKLMEIRANMESFRWESEYMLNPIDNELSLIKREHVEDCYDETMDLTRHRAHYESVWLGVDFAFSDREKADHSAFVIIGLYQDRYYLLDYHRRQGMSASEHITFIQELHAIYKFDMIGLEENSIKSVVKEWKELGLPLKLYRTANIDERDKKTPEFNGVISVSKTNLVLRLGSTFENHGLTLPYKSAAARDKMAQLCEECASWQFRDGKLEEVGAHPDIPIGLGYALEVATKAAFHFEFA